MLSKEERKELSKLVYSKESSLQTKCNKWLNERNILYFHKEMGRGSYNKARGKGLPDLTIFYKGMVLFIELKTKIGKQNKEQKEWQHKSELNGFAYYICNNFEVFKLLLEEFINE